MPKPALQSLVAIVISQKNQDGHRMRKKFPVGMSANTYNETLKFAIWLQAKARDHEHPGVLFSGGALEPAVCDQTDHPSSVTINGHTKTFFFQ